MSDAIDTKTEPPAAGDAPAPRPADPARHVFMVGCDYEKVFGQGPQGNVVGWLDALLQPVRLPDSTVKLRPKTAVVVGSASFSQTLERAGWKVSEICEDDFHDGRSLDRIVRKRVGTQITLYYHSMEEEPKQTEMTLVKKILGFRPDIIGGSELFTSNIKTTVKRYILASGKPDTPLAGEAWFMSKEMFHYSAPPLTLVCLRYSYLDNHRRFTRESEMENVAPLIDYCRSLDYPAAVFFDTDMMVGMESTYNKFSFMLSGDIPKTSYDRFTACFSPAAERLNATLRKAKIQANVQWIQSSMLDYRFGSEFEAVRLQQTEKTVGCILPSPHQNIFSGDTFNIIIWYNIDDFVDDCQNNAVPFVYRRHERHCQALIDFDAEPTTELELYRYSYVIVVPPVDDTDFICDRLLHCFAQRCVPVVYVAPGMTLSPDIDAEGCLTFRNIDELRTVLKTLPSDTQRFARGMDQNYKLFRHLYCGNIHERRAAAIREWSRCPPPPRQPTQAQ